MHYPQGQTQRASNKPSFQVLPLNRMKEQMAFQIQSPRLPDGVYPSSKEASINLGNSMSPDKISPRTFFNNEKAVPSRLRLDQEPPTHRLISPPRPRLTVGNKFSTSPDVRLTINAVFPAAIPHAKTHREIKDVEQIEAPPELHRGGTLEGRTSPRSTKTIKDKIVAQPNMKAYDHYCYKISIPGDKPSHQQQHSDPQVSTHFNGVRQLLSPSSKENPKLFGRRDRRGAPLPQSLQNSLDADGIDGNNRREDASPPTTRPPTKLLITTENSETKIQEGSETASEAHVKGLQARCSSLERKSIETQLQLTKLMNEYEEKLKKAQAEKERMKEDFAAVGEENCELKRKVDSQNRQIESLKIQINCVKGLLNDNKKQSDFRVNSLEKRLDEKTKRVGQLEKMLQVKENILGELMGEIHGLKQQIESDKVDNQRLVARHEAVLQKMTELLRSVEEARIKHGEQVNDNNELNGTIKWLKEVIEYQNRVIANLQHQKGQTVSSIECVEETMTNASHGRKGSKGSRLENVLEEEESPLCK